MDISKLNPSQQEAVTHKNGPLLILAGAGSGKTRVLTYRIAYLILEQGVSPSNILALTFTNKAAGEMKERIKILLSSKLQAVCLTGKQANSNNKGAHSKFPIPNLQNLPYAGTFHSFCARILRKDGAWLGLSPNFLIYDSNDQVETVKEVMKRLDIPTKNYNPNAVLATISQAKNELISCLEYPQYVRGQFQQVVSRIYLDYQKLLKEAQALDFDDLLNETVKLFQKYPTVLENYQNLFQHILVDEWQDTNKAQYLLTFSLAKKQRNLVVVGDCSQSIYGWRGADFKNVMALGTDFPELKTISLEQNYRSTQKILDVAHAVIKNNHSHPVLKLWTKNDQGAKITLYQAKSETDEGQFIVENIKNLLLPPNNLSFSDFAVLYRTNAQSRAVEEVFLHNGIPYVLVGGVRFYDRKEIKDVLAYLRLLINPKDIVSDKRAEGLGKNRYKNFCEYAENFRKEELFKKESTLEILDKSLEVVKYLDLYSPENEEGLMRLENIKELRSVAQEFPDLVDFLTNVSLVQQEYLPNQKPQNINSKKQNAVTLTTAHAAKGLEYPAVFLIGMEEGLFPHSRSLLDQLEIEEERRLCYVGITRAMHYLFLTYATRRLYFGQRSSNLVSRFISEIPEELLDIKSPRLDFDTIDA
ncbi:MAG: UvrD-helicase domain-containing protein [bacterium]|nr:UvrD-helicase domain-containing protein [bacterium]